MDMLTQPLTVLTVAAGLALAVERALEVIKQVSESHDPVSRSSMLDRVHETTATALQSARSALIDINDTSHSSELETVDKPATKSISESAVTEDGISVHPVTRPSLKFARRIAFYQLFAAGLGIILANLFNVQLFNAFFSAIRPELVQSLTAMPWVDEILTGIVIGGGSQPVHLLMNFLTKRQNSPGRTV